ncbi:MAG: pallilysin-related adhesin [Spirochaetaceae bacterium]|jgi:flagellar motor protein MotB|nr:pallilysin-related adhesin [Spirochaetaceae bacterium]
MTRKIFKALTVTVFILTALGIGALVWLPKDPTGTPVKKQRQTKIITPLKISAETPAASLPEPESVSYAERFTAKVPLGEGEILVSLLTANLDKDAEEEQIIAYRNIRDADSPVAITYIDFDETLGAYTRLWSAPTSASRPGTISLYAQDLVGDRNDCVILSGMNREGAYTMTVFRRDGSQGRDYPFPKIAELEVHGSIAVQEAPRTQAYQQGFAKGQAFPLVARERDESSSNPLDQKEITYTYNEETGVYEQTAVTRIPGKQIEERRLETLLASTRGFEGFLSGLWYYVSPQGTVDTRQYIYFDPRQRELIFYGDESQQVFTWHGSNQTRYGLYIASQNVSVTNLRRSLEIELDSLESIRVRVSEDVRLRLGVTASWDGSYRKAGASLDPASPPPAVPPLIEGQYSGSIGMLSLFKDGAYAITSQGAEVKGKYAFFVVNGEELVEFRPDRRKSRTVRELYLLNYDRKDGDDPHPPENLTLLPVRLGIGGVERLRESALTLIAYNPEEAPPLPVIAEATAAPEEKKPVPVLSYSSQPDYFSPDGDGVADELTMFMGVQSTFPVTSWSFEIREPQPPYQVFYRFEGTGKPAERVVWNGRSARGELVQAATDYPFTFKAEDDQGGVGVLEGHIGVDVLIIREGENLRIQVPSIIFRAGYADFIDLAQETVDNNNRVLRRIAEILNKFRDYRVLIEGHANRTKARADEAAEEERTELHPLSESRARTVVNYLVEFGVSRSRLSARGLGSTKPVAKFEDQNDWWKNRRVEFILIK